MRLLSGQDGGLEDAIIGGSLKLIKKENVDVELTNMIHQETQESLVHIYRYELIEHSISSDFFVSKNVNVENDQIEHFEDVIIDEFLELIGDEEYFLCGSGYAQL